VEALTKGLKTGGFGSCATYFERLQECFPQLECLFSSDHCVGFDSPDGLFVDISYYMDVVPRKSLEGEGVVSSSVLDEKREVTTYWTDGKLCQRTAKRPSVPHQGGKIIEMKEGDVQDFKIAAWSLISMKRMKQYLMVKGAEYEPEYLIEIDQNLFIRNHRGFRKGSFLLSEAS
jgi:hypothetical protein